MQAGTTIRADHWYKELFKKQAKIRHFAVFIVVEKKNIF